MKRLASPSLRARLIAGMGRRKLLWLSVPAVVGVLLGSGLGSYFYWSDYAQRDDMMRQSVKSEMTKALAMPAGTAAERVRKVTALQQAAAQATKLAQECTPSPLTGWQTRLPSLGQLQTECQAVVRTVVKTGTALTTLATYVKDETALYAPIQTGVARSAQSPAEWQANAEAWTTTYAAVRAQSVSAAAQPLKALLEVRVGAVRDAWLALVAADSVKDQAKYEAAVAQYAKAYEGLQAAVAESDTLCEAQFKAFHRLYEATLAAGV